jgi:limonene-1,2-epoxide hydrolase
MWTSEGDCQAILFDIRWGVNTAVCFQSAFIQMGIAIQSSHRARSIHMSNKQIISEFIQTWASLDANKIAAYFTDDGVYYNMPAQPVQGRNEIRDFINSFAGAWTKTDWEILNIVEDGDVVIAERVDKTDIGDKHVDLPCTGVFEMQDGKIKVWRDYFDLGTYMKAFE